MTYVQPALFEPPTIWRPTPVKDLPAWAGAKRVSVDVETHDDQLTTLGPGVRRGGRIVGIGFAIEDGPAHYLPIAHAGGDNLDPAHVLAYLRDQAAAYRGDVCGAKLSYDLDYLAEAGVWFAGARFFRDVQVAEPLLDELQQQYNLEVVAARHQLPGKDESHLREAAVRYGLRAKADLWKLPARHVGAYGEQDVRLPLNLLRRQEKQIDDQDLWRVYDLESRVLPILVQMTRRGVKVDQAQLDKVEAWARAQEEEATAKVRALSGVPIGLDDVLKPELVARALETTGVVLPLTKETKKPSVTAQILDGIDHEIARAIARARKVNKIRTTFVQSIRDHMIPATGRVHCTFNQLRNEKEDGDPIGAAYGRISSSDPNLQQQPSRDEEIAPMWRAIYVPDEGKKWASLDYSQQEPRMTVHYAVLDRCVGSEDFAEIYRSNPDADCYDLVSQAAGTTRKQAKEIFLGLSYGMGSGKLCRKLKLPTKVIISRRTGQPVEVAGEEGQKLMDLFRQRVPFVGELAKNVENKAKRRGYIITIGGRRCRFPESKKAPGEYEWTFKALNRLIQGSSADQTKTAMVEIDRAGFALQLQVHDEVDLSVADQAEADAAAQIMRTCLAIQVPCKVDAAVGDNWGDTL